MRNLRREELVSLLLHMRVLQHAEDDLFRVRTIARFNLRRARHMVRGGYSHHLLNRWEEALDRNDLDLLRNLCLREDAYGIDARQLGPFAGVLSPGERLEVLEQARLVWRRSVAHAKVRPLNNDTKEGQTLDQPSACPSHKMISNHRDILLNDSGRESIPRVH